MGKMKSGSDSFDSLMRGLVAVPKSEVEAEERKWQAQRERLQKKGAAKAKKKREGT